MGVLGEITWMDEKEELEWTGMQLDERWMDGRMDAGKCWLGMDVMEGGSVMVDRWMEWVNG